MEAQLTGEWDDENRLSAKLEQFRGSSNQAATLPQTGSIQGTYDPFDDVIKGVWQTDADTAGEFCWVKVAGQGLEKPDPATVASNGLLGPARQFAFNAKLLLDKRRRLVFIQKHKGLLVVLIGLAVAVIFGFIMAGFLADN